MDAPSISVVISGLVAIAGIFSPVVADWIKYKREQKETEIKLLANAATELLGALSEFHPQAKVDLVGRPMHVGFGPNNIVLLNKYFAWELAIIHKCNEPRLQRVKKLYSEIVGYDIHGKIDEIANEVVALTSEIKTSI